MAAIHAKNRLYISMFHLKDRRCQSTSAKTQ